MMPAGARSKPHPIRPRPPTVLLAAILGVSLFPTTLARELPTYKVHAFLPPDLYRESETPEELNPSAVSRMRDQIREVDPGVTQLGTLPSWVFPLFAHAALEPDFGPHRDITGRDVPVALAQCIPSLKSPEYRRLIGIRNRVWATIIREFPEINHWIVGPEPIYYRKGLYSPLVDCKGRNLRGFDVIEFIVDTLEELHPAINQANPCAKVIAHFSYVPFDEDPDIDLPRLIQVEIQRRGNDPKEYYDLLAEQAAPQFDFVPWGGVLLDQFPEGRCTLDFAHFGNGPSIRSDLVLVNRTTSALRPSVLFFDQKRNPVPPDSLVDVAEGLEFQDGALRVRTELAPLGETKITTNGRGDLVTGSVRIVSDGPVGGVLRFNVSNVGVSGVGISRPVNDALFPVRRQEGGVRTAAAIHNLSTKKIELTCQLMKEGIILEEVGVSVEANGQVAQFIDEMFIETDTSDFAGSVRCAAPWRELFTGMAVEMDANSRIFTTLPIVPVRQWPLENLH